MNTNNNYHKKISNYIIDCQQYKEWAKNNDSYCICNKQFDENLDDFMVQCDGCKEWYHPECLKQTREDVTEMDNWICDQCIEDDNNNMNNDNNSDISMNSNENDEKSQSEMEMN